MAKKSAGILLYRVKHKIPQVLIVHPGGPYWANKDLGAWSIPKGEFTEEDPLAAALREFEEETGASLAGEFIAMTPVKLQSGKTIFAFMKEGDFDTSALRSNTFTLEWPPKSGKQENYPEVDRAEWVEIQRARQKLTKGQVKLVDELAKSLGLKQE